MWQNILVMRFMETMARAMLHHNNVYASFISIHLLCKKIYNNMSSKDVGLKKIIIIVLSICAI